MLRRVGGRRGLRAARHDGAVASAPSVAPGVPASARATRVRLPGRFPAARAALLVAGERDAFALTGAWAGAAAIVGAAPVELLAPEADPFEALDRLPVLGPGSDPGVVVGGGWFGALAYGLAGRCEPTVPGPPRGLGLPAAPLAYYDHVLLCDRKGGWWFEALATPGRAAALQERLDELAGRLAAAPRPRPARLRDVRLRPPGAAGHLLAVAACRERIAAGELFQANLCLHLDAELDGRPADLAVAAAEGLSPAHGALLQGTWGAAISASPELFLRRTGRDVQTEPIKGTSAVGDRDALAASAKDRAENVMIVDLMRNDLGRVCEYGSVVVGRVAEAHEHVGVIHLTSRVSGTLRRAVSDAELLRATFPPGSVTGAPKVQALRVIAELEAASRALYTGAIGYASPLAGLELSVAIRTFEAVGGRVRLGVGGGITAGSEPEAELEECLVKARPLLALGHATPPTTAIRRAPAADDLPRALARGRERPDPALGLFETLRIRDGTPQRLPEHLARLLASATELGFAVPGDLRSRVITAAAGHTGRLRLDLSVDGGVTFSCGPPPAPAGAIRLVAVLLPGGLGRHKWADRRLLDALSAEHGAVPLIVDGDGAVLEAGWASVWLEEAGGRLVTPEADGRLLPGVTRAALLAGDPRCSAGPVGLERLREARALHVSSSLRGLVPAVLTG